MHILVWFRPSITLSSEPDWEPQSAEARSPCGKRNSLPRDPAVPSIDWCVVEGVREVLGLGVRVQLVGAKASLVRSS